MAHRLIPEPERPPLDPSEVIRRLRQEFAVVHEDRRKGARHIDQMIAQFRKMNAPGGVIEAHRRSRGEAIHVVVTDDPTSEVAYLSFVATREEALFIGYHSKPHEDAARPVLEKCARVLGYAIELA